VKIIRTVLPDYRPLLAMIDAQVYVMQYPVAISHYNFLLFDIGNK